MDNPKMLSYHKREHWIEADVDLKAVRYYYDILVEGGLKIEFDEFVYMIDQSTIYKPKAIDKITDDKYTLILERTDINI